MEPRDTIDAEALALQALAATLADEKRAERLLALTGITPDELRGRLGDPSLLVACLDFLESHEPDLLAVAELMATSPETIVAARRSLEA
ncbi:DUF3572 family protein [Sphingomicrobium clamense]|uniref:DUF3572 domain-containing protein n=1 Tax=Sphingomicrobium clamense TaxID=2851013 RepID=A0ABS6V2T4_9SPHN|nr:DUF3572 family protein [Sphingomicrobium sp. B8]MBW0143854.1 DUF3572 domain-containing protein [Sphingomicrobium sp. B8]